MTTDSTQIRCGEHGLPLFYALASVFCEDGCDLSWSDLQPEVGEKIATRDIGEITHVAVVVEHAVEHGLCPLHGEPLLADDRDPSGLSCLESGFEACVTRTP